MKKTIYTLYIFASILFIAGLIGFTVYSFVNTRNDNVFEAEINFNKFVSIFKMTDLSDDISYVVNKAKYTVAVVDDRNVYAIKPLNIDSEKFTLNNSKFYFTEPAIFGKTFYTILKDKKDRKVIIYSLYPAYSDRQIYKLFKEVALPLLIFLVITMLMIPLSYLRPASRSKRKINKPDFDIDDREDNPYLKNGSDTFFEEEKRIENTSVPKKYSGKIHSGANLQNENNLESKLHSELKRAASFDQDIVLALISCRNINTDEKFENFSDIIKQNFIFHDLLFEFGDYGLAIILPNMDLDHGIRKLESIQEELVRNSIINDKCSSTGLSSRNGRLLSGKRLIQEAQAAMKKAIEDEKNSIIGFRSDPQKFREYLARKNN